MTQITSYTTYDYHWEIKGFSPENIPKSKIPVIVNIPSVVISFILRWFLSQVLICHYVLIIKSSAKL